MIDRDALIDSIDDYSRRRAKYEPVSNILQGVYGVLEWQQTQDAMDELVSCILSQNTNDANRDVALALMSICLGFGLAWVWSGIVHVPRSQRGTFIQNSFHGNMGYIGLAVSFYYLGREGFVQASILAGFMMILQNFLGVIALQVYAENNSLSPNRWTVVLKIIGNPIVVSAVAGIAVSVSAVKVPLVIGRCLDILSDLALPLALLIIGASLSFDMIRSRLMAVLSTGMLKLLLLPGIGYTLYRFCGLLSDSFLPAVILLASPTATVTYVMAKEMGGDSDFAVAAVSLHTLLSALTYMIWLSIVG